MIDSINLDWVKAGEGRPEVVVIATAARPFVEAAINCPTSTFDAAAQRGHYVEAICDGLRLVAESPSQEINESSAANAQLALWYLTEMKRRASLSLQGP